LQCLFAHSGITDRISAMMNSHAALPNSGKVMLLQCIANMAASKENAAILKQTIPLVIKRLDSSLELERTVSFQALTNLSFVIAPSQIEIFLPVIPICLKRQVFVNAPFSFIHANIQHNSSVYHQFLVGLWEKGETNINSLRLLINLSCCPDMVPYILAAKTVTGLLSILDTDKPEILLRAVTWLLCMSTAVQALSVTYEVIAPLNQDPFANPNYTVYFSIYAPKGKRELVKRLNEIATGADEAARKAKQLLETLAKIPDARSLLSNLNRL
uniref:Arm_2 domain-containing protein n=1 Tax=Gongylonema pulchrum TaxID=637853 RepID=A0A183CWV2_9BILA